MYIQCFVSTTDPPGNRSRFGPLPIYPLRILQKINRGRRGPRGPMHLETRMSHVEELPLLQHQKRPPDSLHVHGSAWSVPSVVVIPTTKKARELIPGLWVRFVPNSVRMLAATAGTAAGLFSFLFSATGTTAGFLGVALHLATAAATFRLRDTGGQTAGKHQGHAQYNHHLFHKNSSLKLQITKVP